MSDIIAFTIPRIISVDWLSHVIFSWWLKYLIGVWIVHDFFFFLKILKENHKWCLGYIKAGCNHFVWAMRNYAIKISKCLGREQKQDRFQISDLHLGFWYLYYELPVIWCFMPFISFFSISLWHFLVHDASLYLFKLISQ